MLMHDSRDIDHVFLPFVENCEREAKDKALANAGRFDGGRIRELLDSARGLFDRRQKVSAESVGPFLIETRAS